MKLDPATEVLPVNGSREALFAFAQASVDSSRHGRRVVISPNPFYQIYEGAALLAGARPFFLNTLPENGFRMDWSRVPEDLWEQVNLIYVCSPGNPTGKVMSLADWKELFELSDRHGFVIAADECYSEIYFEEGAPPLGALTAAQQLGRGLRNLIVFNSLSKRSNVPGLRSGMVAGDAAIMKSFLLYRTYHGSAMSPAVQAASIAAWNDEAHVIENRRQYAEKFAAVMPLLKDVLAFDAPDAAFYLWARVPGGDDAAFARELYRTPARHRAARQLSRARRRQRQSGPGLRPHRAGRQPGRLRRGGQAHRQLRRQSRLNTHAFDFPSFIQPLQPQEPPCKTCRKPSKTPSNAAPTSPRATPSPRSRTPSWP